MVGEDHAAGGGDQLGRQQPRLPQAGRQLQHALAVLGLDRLDHPVRHRRAKFANRLLAAYPAARRLLPVLGAAAAVLLGGVLAVPSGIGAVARRRSRPRSTSV